MNTEKTIPLTRWTFVGKVKSLLFNMRLVIIAFEHFFHWRGYRHMKRCSKSTTREMQIKTIMRYHYAMLCYAKSLQSCPTLCNPIDGSPPGSPIPGILQARTLEWVAISFSNAWKWKLKVKSLSCLRLLATPWIAA